MKKISKLVESRLDILKKKQKKKSEFIISVHAYKRLCERLGCNKNKIEKVVSKAWRSNDMATFIHLENFNRYDGFCYRSFNGYVFIFSIKESIKKILVTVIPYNKKQTGLIKKPKEIIQKKYILAKKGEKRYCKINN